MRRKPQIELNSLEIVTIILFFAGGTENNPAKRWEEFTQFLASPRLLSGLI
ncbi:MAG: hypothetical protein ABR936_03560 [Bacteroidota bacterium]|jgi:hypothetical protein